MYISGNKRKRKETDYIFIQQRRCLFLPYNNKTLNVLMKYFSYIYLTRFSWYRNLNMTWIHYKNNFNHKEKCWFVSKSPFVHIIYCASIFYKYVDHGRKHASDNALFCTANIRSHKLAFQYYVELKSYPANPAHNNNLYPKYKELFQKNEKVIKPFGLRMETIIGEVDMN